MALQRPELRPVHDVRPARRRRPSGCGPTGLVLGISDFVSDPASELPHRSIERSLFVSLGIPNGSAPCRDGSGSGIPRLFGLRLVRTGTTGGLAAFAAGVDAFSTQCLWFLLPTVLSLAEGLRVPQSRYSSGVFAVMHSAQYLWITSYYARREAGAKGAGGWRPFAYFAVLVAGGIALFVPGPWLASRLFHSTSPPAF